MRLEIRYEKRMVLQALRYHFISRREIKLMMILVNVFALLAAVLYAFKLITPLPFLMSSVLWMSMMVAFWIWLPSLVYRKSKTFKDNFAVRIEEHHFFIETNGNQRSWAWREFSSYYETPNFFHLYFDSKTFFLIPKSAFTEQEQLDQARTIFRNNVQRG
ncbi:MAG: YcxB family protein [Chitinophagaceae bacterium]